MHPLLLLLPEGRTPYLSCYWLLPGPAGFPQTPRPREQRGLFQSREEQVQPLEPQLSPGKALCHGAARTLSPRATLPLYSLAYRGPLTASSGGFAPSWWDLSKSKTSPDTAMLRPASGRCGSRWGGGAPGRFRWGLLCSSPFPGKGLKLQLLPKELGCPSPALTSGSCVKVWLQVLLCLGGACQAVSLILGGSSATFLGVPSSQFFLEGVQGHT